MKNEDEMNEMKKQVDTLKKELNEINLLNAKLLYVNKIFRSKNLTESQKSKVLGAFDKANTVKEAKLVFETISESVKVNREVVRENLGRASKPAGVARKQPIMEIDSQVSRWQKLAGIK
jgi:prolyl oligopeptidase PreP (S9A serine peptidase family)